MVLTVATAALLISALPGGAVTSGLSIGTTTTITTATTRPVRPVVFA